MMCVSKVWTLALLVVLVLTGFVFVSNRLQTTRNTTNSRAEKTHAKPIASIEQQNSSDSESNFILEYFQFLYDKNERNNELRREYDALKNENKCGYLEGYNNKLLTLPQCAQNTVCVFKNTADDLKMSTDCVDTKALLDNSFVGLYGGLDDSDPVLYKKILQNDTMTVPINQAFNIALNGLTFQGQSNSSIEANPHSLTFDVDCGNDEKKIVNTLSIKNEGNRNRTSDDKLSINPWIIKDISCRYTKLGVHMANISLTMLDQNDTKYTKTVSFTVDVFDTPKKLYPTQSKKK